MSLDDFAVHDVEVPGARVRCYTAGAGDPVLLLHGYPQNSHMWAHVAPALAEDHVVVCADLRGYGRSEVTHAHAADVASYSFRAMAADLVAAMHALGHHRFAVVGHDRGGRVAHRMTLDHPDSVTRLAVLDIVPTLEMWRRVDKATAAAYWHWHFLQTASPFAERLIEAQPDYFFETCIETWGATRVEDLDQAMLDHYREDWRRPEVIHASCQDYRAAATVDLADDETDHGRQVNVPTLALWGADGRIGRLFDVPGVWRAHASDLRAEPVPGGHFFVDTSPVETRAALRPFLR